MKGTNADSFKYIGKSPLSKIEGKTDAEHFEHTVNTLAMVNVDGDKLKTLMRAVSIVLQCGNMTFGSLRGDKDKSEITSSGAASDLADLMGVSVNDLTMAFTERSFPERPLPRPATRTNAHGATGSAHL